LLSVTLLSDPYLFFLLLLTAQLSIASGARISLNTKHVLQFGHDPIEATATATELLALTHNNDWVRRRHGDYALALLLAPSLIY